MSLVLRTVFALVCCLVLVPSAVGYDAQFWIGGSADVGQSEDGMEEGAYRFDLQPGESARLTIWSRVTSGGGIAHLSLNLVALSETGSNDTPLQFVSNDAGGTPVNVFGLGPSDTECGYRFEFGNEPVALVDHLGIERDELIAISGFTLQDLPAGAASGLGSAQDICSSPVRFETASPFASVDLQVPADIPVGSVMSLFLQIGANGIVFANGEFATEVLLGEVGQFDDVDTLLDSGDLFDREWSSESPEVVVTIVEPDGILGDIDGDQCVDALDAGILFSQWGSAGTGDITGDGIVDAADAAILFEMWGTGCDSATLPSTHPIRPVPAPTTDSGWIMWSILAGIAWRRRTARPIHLVTSLVTISPTQTSVRSFQSRDRGFVPMRRIVWFAGAVIWCATAVADAAGQSVWIEPGIGNWFSPGLWQPAGVPNATTDVVIANGGTAMAHATLVDHQIDTANLTVGPSPVGGYLQSTIPLTVHGTAFVGGQPNSSSSSVGGVLLSATFTTEQLHIGYAVPGQVIASPVTSVGEFETSADATFFESLSVGQAAQGAVATGALSVGGLATIDGRKSFADLRIGYLQNGNGSATGDATMTGGLAAGGASLKVGVAAGDGIGNADGSLTTGKVVFDTGRVDFGYIEGGAGGTARGQSDITGGITGSNQSRDRPQLNIGVNANKEGEQGRAEGLVTIRRGAVSRFGDVVIGATPLGAGTAMGTLHLVDASLVAETLTLGNTSQFPGTAEAIVVADSDSHIEMADVISIGDGATLQSGGTVVAPQSDVAEGGALVVSGSWTGNLSLAGNLRFTGSTRIDGAIVQEATSVIEYTLSPKTRPPTIEIVGDVTLHGALQINATQNWDPPVDTPFELFRVTGGQVDLGETFRATLVDGQVHAINVHHADTFTHANAIPTELRDLNGNGQLDPCDVDTLAEWLLTGERPHVIWLNADTNQDNNLDFADIDTFVAGDFSGGCPVGGPVIAQSPAIRALADQLRARSVPEPMFGLSLVLWLWLFLSAERRRTKEPMPV